MVLIRCLVCFWCFFLTLEAFAREHIHIVGSTAVFSFTSTTAEEFARTHRVKTPIVESTGTSTGFKLFCSGTGEGFPDIVSASRKITETELALCKINSIEAQEIEEIKLGDDAIVIASSKYINALNFNKEDIFKAISFYALKDNMSLVENYYKNWKQINSDLPDLPIRIYGPLRNTGTFDSVIHMIMLDQCLGREAFKMTYEIKDLKKFCSVVRSDEAYIEVSNDENIVIQKIAANKNSFGIISYSFFARNQDKIIAHKINAIEPNYQNILDGIYPVSRPIYLYVKKPHLTPNLKLFLQEAVSQDALGQYGYLRKLGIIAPNQQELDETRAKIKNLQISAN